jgi:hypothetical protein
LIGSTRKDFGYGVIARSLHLPVNWRTIGGLDKYLTLWKMTAPGLVVRR